MKSIFFICALFFGNGVYSAEKTPIIQTPLGKIQGLYKESFNKNLYAAYEGIRYAQPPIGVRRFKESEMVRAWRGVWDATQLHTCLQHDMLNPKQYFGDEDCLFLNVYMPKNASEKRLKVLVDIHGGAFMYHSGHDYTRPDYLMDREIIFISINYRLNLFGFLSTGDELVPGNNGLKDQLLALKWIQNNIASFNGDPTHVTIMGYSAGGASVHYHLLSPMSDGLFHRAIPQSGTALNPWALQRNPMRYTKILAQGVGCDFEKSNEIVNCLKQRPYQQLVEQYPTFFDYEFTPITPFGPVVEKDGPYAFLKVHPYVSYRKGLINDVPILGSHTSNEGLFFPQFIPGLLKAMNEKWEEIAAALLDYDHPNSQAIAKQIRDFYMGEEPGCQFTNEIVDKMLSDRYTLNDGEIAIRFLAKYNKSPLYYYIFGYLGDGNANTVLGGIPHGHDLQYWFTPHTKLFNSAHNANDLKMKDFMLDLITGFAIEGVPPKVLKWEPVTFDRFKVLNITTYDPKKLKMQTVKEFGSRAFWDTLNLKENQAVVKDEL